MPEELQDNPELCDNSPMQADLNPRSDMTAQTPQLDKTFPEKVIAPAGTYWVGDPCYSVPDDRWMEWLEAAEYDHPDRGDAPLIAELDGLTVVGVSTAYGDGDYPSYSLPEKGRKIKFWVDAGMIGLVPAVVMGLLDQLAHMTEAQDNARSEVGRLTEARHETPDVTELRQALGLSIRDVLRAELGHEEPVDPHSWRCADKVRYPGPCGCADEVADAATTAAAPGPLNALTAARAEVERLTALVERVVTAARTATPTNGHAWAEGHREAVEQILDSWPEPACLLHDVSGEDVRGWEMAECTCPTRPLTAAGIIPLPMGLCGIREDHEPHLVPYAAVANGPMWCTADQSKREPYASERRRDEAGTGGAEPS